MNSNYFAITKNGLYALLLIYSGLSLAGPYPPAADQPGTTAIAADDPQIIGWANGYTNYLPGTYVLEKFKTPDLAVGIAGGETEDFTFHIVSLGRGGSITMKFFPQPITNGDGDDFAVFENSYSHTFLELGWVEVSSNGIDFVRFPAASLTVNPVGRFENVDTTNINGFAGKYIRGFGTPFDLDHIKDNPNIDVSRVTHIRIKDIVGDGTNFDDLSPPFGPNPIYDPSPTEESAGFDLDAIGVMNLGEAIFEENVPIPKFFVLLLGLLCFMVIRRKNCST